MFGSFGTASPRHSVINTESINAAQVFVSFTEFYNGSKKFLLIQGSSSVKSSQSDSLSVSRQLSGDFHENKTDIKYDSSSPAVSLPHFFTDLKSRIKFQ